MSIFVKPSPTPDAANLPGPVAELGAAGAMPRVPDGALDDMLVFAVAARHRSMERAADVLKVPAERVQAQVARLEATVGAALWEGRGAALHPTPTGADLADTLTAHLRPIAQSLNRARLAAQPLVIACADEEIAEAILRRLPALHAGMGPIRLTDGAGRERADLRIGWAPQAGEAGEWFDLFGEERCVMAAPALAATLGDSADIARLPLLTCGPEDEATWRAFLGEGEAHDAGSPDVRPALPAPDFGSDADLVGMPIMVAPGLSAGDSAPDGGDGADGESGALTAPQASGCAEAGVGALRASLLFRPCASAADLRAAALEGAGAALLDATLSRPDMRAGRLTRLSRRTVWTRRQARAFLPDATPNWDRADDLVETLMTQFQKV